MSHLLAAITLTGRPKTEPVVDAWLASVHGVLGNDEVARARTAGFSALVVGRPMSLNLAGGGGAGLSSDESDSTVAWCGLILDTQSPVGSSACDVPGLVDSAAYDNPSLLNRYEGAFAMVAWDARLRRALVLNDQASMLNLYTVENAGVLWVTTAAVPLAKALGLGLDPEGVCELMARGSLLAPTSIFAGMRRLGLGEHVAVANGVARVATHWSPYRDVDTRLSLDGASELLANTLTDRMKRLAVGKEPVAADLSGGLDSRLVVAALDSAGVRFGVMTYGPPDSADVKISQAIARSMEWPSRYFRPEEFTDIGMTDEYRRELLWRTAGELAFPAIFHGSLFRKELAAGHGVHVSGSTGELTRYFPWSQEFLGIGRRRPANVGNALRYRFLQERMPPAGMFVDGWLPPFSSRLAERIGAVCALGAHTTTTQQMDAVYLWKMTSHASLYISATFGYLPNLAPMGLAGVLDVNLSIPWWHKLTTQLNRLTNHRLSPRVAAFPTCYGGTGAPPNLRTLPLEARQVAMQLRHLAEKVERVALRGAISRRLRPPTQPAVARRPYLTQDFRQMMAPASMLSRSLYHADFLGTFLRGKDDELSTREPFLSRMATVEHLCREVGFEPGPGFLLHGSALP